MTINFKDEIIIYNTYSKEEYDRSNILVWLMRIIYKAYHIEYLIIDKINQLSNNKILSDCDGNYSVRIYSINNKIWYLDNSPERLLKLLDMSNLKRDFIDLFDYFVKKNIKDENIGMIEFHFYMFNIKIENILRIDDEKYDI